MVIKEVLSWGAVRIHLPVTKMRRTCARTILQNARGFGERPFASSVFAAGIGNFGAVFIEDIRIRPPIRSAGVRVK